MSQQRVIKRYVGKHACESCRKSKTRCIVDTLEQHKKCRKCLEHATLCEWKEISQTRNRRRTDTRVAMLEEQLRSITAKLQDLDSKSDGIRSESAVPPSEWQGNHDQQQSRPETSVPSVTTTSPFELPEAHPHIYHIDTTETSPRHGAELNVALPMYRLSEKKRAELLITFASKLHPLYPVTGLAAGTLAELGQQRPYTLNSMIVAACILDEPTLFKDMHDATIHIMAHLVVVSGEKSLDLVQALLVAAAWADSPDDMAHLNIFQWTHLAYSMAVELGLVGRSSKPSRKQGLAQSAQGASDGKTEKLWTLLALCLSCSRVDISFRRQSIVSLDRLVGDALPLFELHAASADDHRLVAWLRLQLIAEEVENMKQELEMRHPPNVPLLKELEYSSLDERLQEWESVYGSTVMNASLEIELGFCRSKLHELVAHFGEDGRHLEMTSLATRSVGPLSGPDTPLNPLSVRTILAFVSDCHSILQGVIHAGNGTLRALPLLSGLRGPYAFKALAMLEKRADNPSDRMSQIIDRETIRWPHYARTVSKLLEEASANGLFVAPTVALRIRNRAVNQERLRREMDVAEQGSYHQQVDVRLSVAGADDFKYDSLVYDWSDFDLSPAMWDLFPFEGEAFQLPL